MEGDELKDSRNATDISPESGSEICYKNVTHAIIDQFNKEIDSKLKLIQLVDRHIEKNQTILKKLRYAIIASYYRNDLNTKDDSTIFQQLETGGKNDETLYTKTQMHPSFNNDIVRSSLLERSLIISRQIVEQKILESNYIEINIGKKNGQNEFKDVTIINNKIKFLLVVGNTSKYLNPITNVNENNQRLFKWVAYVQIKNHSKRIEAIVKKVRFRLHPSYKPNDVLEINSPPFQIIQWGWGGFPLCVQLFFHDELKQKPIQLSHNLVLDKSLSGLHTLGAETIFEIWLPAHKIVYECEENSSTKNICVENKWKLSNDKAEDHDSDWIGPLELKVGKTETSETNLFSDTTLSNVPSTSSDSHMQSHFYVDNIQDVSINGTLEKVLLSQKQEPLGSEAKEDIQNSEKENNLLNIVSKNVCIDKRNERCLPDQSIDKLLKGCRKSISLLNKSYYSNFFNKNHQYFHNKKNKNIVFQKKGKLYIIDPSQIKYRQSQLSQESLLKTNLSTRPKIYWLNQENDLNRKRNENSTVAFNDLEVDKYLNNSQLDHDYIRSPTDYLFMGISKKKNTLESNQSIINYLQTIFKNMIFENFKEVVDKFLKAFPIIKMNEKPYIDLPFMTESFRCFQKVGPIKQRILEWLRARYLIKLIKIHPQIREVLFKRNHLFWTTKEISRYARYKEWTPNIISFQRKSKNNVVSTKDGIYVAENNLKKPCTTLSCNNYICEHLQSFRQNLSTIGKKHSIITNIDVINSETNRNFQRLFNMYSRQKNVGQSILGSANSLEKYLQHISNAGNEGSKGGMHSTCECHTIEILFAHCLYLLIEKLTRFALYKEEEVEENLDLVLNPEAILEAIVRCEELDFLTNICLGACE